MYIDARYNVLYLLQPIKQKNILQTSVFSHNYAIQLRICTTLITRAPLNFTNSKIYDTESNELR